MVNEGVLYDLMNLSRGEVLLQTRLELSDPLPLDRTGNPGPTITLMVVWYCSVYGEHTKQRTLLRRRFPRDKILPARLNLKKLNLKKVQGSAN